MLHIEDLQMISTLANSPSLSAAARALNVTPPALSTRLKRLEAQLKVNLAVRSARHLSLTREGEQLAASAAGLLAQIEALPESFARMGQDVSGSLRITAPFGFGREHIAPEVARFVKAHPRVHPVLELLESPWPDKRDADVVVHIGAVRDSSWVAHLLARNVRWVCASPAYLKARGVPLHPRELVSHATICIRENDEDVSLWHYRKGSTRSAIRVSPTMVSNDGEVARTWAQAGLGVVLRSQWDVEHLVAQGKLVRLLSDWQFDSADIVALVPSRRGNTLRVKACVEHLRAAFSRPAWQKGTVAKR
ncbi:MAG: LysR family transcriptional regulator [Pseudomonadota bacterium]